MWVQSSRLFTGLCHDLAGGVRMVVDNLGLVLCVVHRSYVTALTESIISFAGERRMEDKEAQDCYLF